MQIRNATPTPNFPNNKPTFKGYGARPLENIVIRNVSDFPSLYDATKELMDLSQRYNFGVLVEGKDVSDSLADRSTHDKNKMEMMSPWTQDSVCVYNDKLLYRTLPDNVNYSSSLAKTLGLNQEEVGIRHFIPGGNFFILDNGTILAGKAEGKKSLSKMFGDGKNIVKVPQADCHIDMFIRPLKGNVVLVADDKMTLDLLKRSYRLLQESNIPNKKEIAEKISDQIYEMSLGIKRSPYAETDDVIKELEKNNFKVVRVPGRVIETDPRTLDETRDKLNYVNAIVHEEPNSELVYITNKSNLLKQLDISDDVADKIGLNFEEIFRNAVSEYIRPENVHFIQGKKQMGIADILQQKGGGIHCLCTEVPKTNTPPAPSKLDTVV